MAKIFITGSSDGLGQLAATELIRQGHQVVLHARNENRAKEARAKVPAASAILIADLSNTEETMALAGQVNALGRFDSIIHNAGLYQASAEPLFAVNTLAPYILTCLIEKPERLIYISSDLHAGGHSKFGYFKDEVSRINYSDTKLHVLMLSKAIARKWPDVYANAVHPGWVPTKMGGAGAPDDLKKGYDTQVWLAGSDDEKAKVSGHYFFHRNKMASHPEADQVTVQEAFLNACEAVTGVSLPEF